MTGRLYTVKEISIMLNVSQSTIRRMIYKGQIKAVKLPSGTIRIPEDEVARLLRPEGGDKL
ncbi:MAG: helix-turn-helix domain-containing protein [Nitrososphaerota archaeon]|jgi:excisionase family DNA binding protein|nr:helix-turn-helix domain-containing protein [Nitrososphaerota archaeon]MDG7039441.1 helix-turn-helix domain-containing protein [Nitrososphaerota archaeon]